MIFFSSTGVVVLKMYPVFKSDETKHQIGLQVFI